MEIWTEEFEVSLEHLIGDQTTSSGFQIYCQKHGEDYGKKILDELQSKYLFIYFFFNYLVRLLMFYIVKHSESVGRLFGSFRNSATDEAQIFSYHRPEEPLVFLRQPTEFSHLKFLV